MTISEEALGWLVENDPETLRRIIAHNEFGRSQGCW